VTVRNVRAISTRFASAPHSERADDKKLLTRIIAHLYDIVFDHWLMNRVCHFKRGIIVDLAHQAPATTQQRFLA